MNIFKFLLFDALLVVLVIPFLFSRKRKQNSYFFKGSSEDKVLNKTSINYPDKDSLLELERLAKISSGIEVESLNGNWKFASVWKKGNNIEDSVISSLLRLFSAKINLKREISSNELLRFSIFTSIEFGLFTIEFRGSAYLKEKHTLLRFFFNLIKFKTGGIVFFSKSLDEPEENEQSYISLIALEKNDRWLAGRVQNGSLVIWVKE
tara:strand:- start:258 stop:878 length:621 start_codon:yes stop_codon:yes gene_type:complete